jgi:ubiquinone/menaquinone biosynthesis C-methylase UbiE
MLTQPAILKHMTTVADATRCRMLRLLAGQELTVSELCAVLQLPQSTVSRHLKTLLDDGWITSRRDGTCRFYTMSPDELPQDAGSLWELVGAEVGETPVAGQDDQRLEGVLRSRRARVREFFSAAAEQWDHLRVDLFGRSFQFHALLGLLEDRWTVGDLGCGTGQVSEWLAPWVREVVAVDGSEEMLEAARRRLRALPNVDLRQGELEALPVPDASLDAALLILVLHYVPDPARVLAEAFRSLKPGGRLLIVDMLPHEREEFQTQMGHVWLGFSEPQLSRFVHQAGFASCRVLPLAAEPEARGPALFAATARRA